MKNGETKTTTQKENAMRQEVVECKTRKQAEKQCPWAEKIVKVEGGYMCFESNVDYKIWKNQK